VCCSVLRCVAVCCSVLQCVAVCCSVPQCAAVCCSVLHCVVVYCSVLQSVAVCCRVLPCAAMCCSVLQCTATYCSHCNHVIHVCVYVYVCMTLYTTQPQQQSITLLHTHKASLFFPHIHRSFVAYYSLFNKRIFMILYTSRTRNSNTSSSSTYIR